jgi:hypothetical protein
MVSPDAKRRRSVICGQPAAFFRIYAAMLAGMAALFAWILLNQLLFPFLPPRLRFAVVVAGVVGISAANLYLAWRAIRYIRWFNKRRGSCCFRCGYPMKGIDTCPECGSRRDLDELEANWRSRCHDGFLRRPK